MAITMFLIIIKTCWCQLCAVSCEFINIIGYSFDNYCMLLLVFRLAKIIKHI